MSRKAKASPAPTRAEVLNSPLLRKGGKHEKTGKALRRRHRANLKSEWGCLSA